MQVRLAKANNIPSGRKITKMDQDMVVLRESVIDTGQGNDWISLALL